MDKDEDEDEDDDEDDDDGKPKESQRKAKGKPKESQRKARGKPEESQEGAKKGVKREPRAAPVLGASFDCNLHRPARGQRPPPRLSGQPWREALYLVLIQFLV